MLKVSFFDHHLRDAVYARRMKLKGTDVFLSEDLTLKKSALAYEAREYARKYQNVTTWTVDGNIFLKDSMEAKPHVIHSPDDLNPAVPAIGPSTGQSHTY